MDFPQYFPLWSKLTDDEQKLLSQSVVRRNVKKGTLLQSAASDCMGLLVIRSGQLRAFIASDEGREITTYRLFEHDICLFTASCMMQNIQFDLSIESEKDTDFWIIPPYIYKKLMTESAAVANYTNQLMASRFSEVIWLMEQIMWKSMDKRLAAFLLEESSLEDSTCLKITHEKIANHLGTAREVITRMLRYFQSEKMVALTRGTIEILDEENLRRLSNSSFF